MTLSRVIRTVATATLMGGVAAPLVRRKLKLHPAAVLGSAAAAPVALCVLTERSKKRDLAVTVLQMWAYFAAYEMPADDMEKIESRVKVRYPIVFDEALGFGKSPGVRLQQRFHTAGHYKPWEKVLAWSHAVWFAVPHSAALYVLFTRPEQYAKLAPKLYLTFDLGAAVYWMLPTAPPWYANERGEIKIGDGPEFDRLLIGYGQQFLGDRFDLVYGALAGNPLAAMPSLHFGCSVAAAEMLADTGPVAGAIGRVYAGTLGVALVYLGEHYVLDLLAGGALALLARKIVENAESPAAAFSSFVQALERAAAKSQ